MKQFLIILALIPFGSRTQTKPGLELHCSGNRPFGLTETNTYYGGGIGANVLFRDTSVFNIKTGLEVNYFHTWDDRSTPAKMSSTRDLHYRYAVVSIPAFVRLTFGNRVKFFLEGGAYLGFSPGGQVRYMYTSYASSPGQFSVTSEKKNGYNTGLSISPAAALGMRFPLSERIDLFVKPEIAFTKSSLLKGLPLSGGSGYNEDYDFNYSYLYARLCVGVHLKPKTR